MSTYFAQILARIESRMPELRQIGVAAGLEQAVDALRAYPSVFLYQPSESAAENENLDGVLQQVTDRFGVLIAVRDLSDARGEAALRQIDVLRRDLKAALLGSWEDPTDVPPETIEYQGGSLAYAKDGTLIWLDNFISHHLERA
ncbi:MAG TPA: hypothetical protein VNL74_01030 [Methylococcus sp.]|nr:hypothetical protein [Methylococcus sp.]